MSAIQKQWNVVGTGSLDSLQLKVDASVPQLREKDVLVKFRSASLNYRDLIIPMGYYSYPSLDNVVPVSDGAGEVEAVGTGVSRFKNGDKVLPIFNQAHTTGPLDYQSIGTGVGGNVDGVMRQFGAFDEQGLVRMPENLSFEEASTLGCAGLTAWNALFGLVGRRVSPGDWVLVQGTGGVSLFDLQFAKATGAKVIATTSSHSKADKLKALGADYVLNYKSDPKWGETARSLTPGGIGLQFVVEVGGPSSIAQSLKAVAFDGIISIVGFLGGVQAESQPSFLEVIGSTCIVRGVLTGSRTQFEEMNRAVVGANIKPMLDEKSFKFEELKQAYQYMWEQKNFGKVCINID